MIITWTDVARGIVRYGQDPSGQWWIEDRSNDPTGPFDSEAQARDAAEVAAMLIRVSQNHQSPPVCRYEYRGTKIEKVGWEYRGVMIERAGWDYIVWLDFVRPRHYQPQCASLKGCCSLINANRG